MLTREPDSEPWFIRDRLGVRTRVLSALVGAPEVVLEQLGG